MSAILKFDFQKKMITFLRRQLSKLHDKDTILHVTITFSLKQGQTRTSSGSIWVPLIFFCHKEMKKNTHDRETVSGRCLERFVYARIA